MLNKIGNHGQCQFLKKLTRLIVVFKTTHFKTVVQFLMKTFELLKQKSETKDVEPDSTMKQVSQNKNTLRLDTI